MRCVVHRGCIRERSAQARGCEATEGRAVQIRGRIEEYDGRAEIILKNQQQLADAASLLPPSAADAALDLPYPRDYDVENRG